MPVYKTEADGSRLALVITDAGLQALGIEPDAPAAEEAPAEQPHLREAEGRQEARPEPGDTAEAARLRPARASPAPAPSRRCSSAC